MHAKSNCLPAFGQWPGTKSSGSWDSEMCKKILNILDGKGLSDAVSFLCEVQGKMFNLTDFGCSALANLAVASRIFVCLIVLTILLNVFTIFFAVVFFNIRPTLRVRGLVQVSSAGAFLACAMGFFVYTFLGGALDDRILGSVLSLVMKDGRNQSFTSYSIGFAIAICAAAFQLFSSFLGVVMVPRKLCHDASDDDDDDRTSDELMRLYRRGDYKNIMV